MSKKKVSLLLFAFVLAMPAWQAVHGQSKKQVLTETQTAARNPTAASYHYDGLLREHRGDDRGTFAAYLQAAEQGYPPAQRRLGEIYDSGNSAVERNYEESIRWYQKAREGGEQIPPHKPRMPLMQ